MKALSHYRGAFLILALGPVLVLRPVQAAGQLDSLITSAPFGQAMSGLAAGAAGMQPLEFRAVLEENGQQLFSIYDTAAKRSSWVGLNDASDEFVVKSYDAEHQSVAVVQHGRLLTLSLKSAPHVMQPPAPMLRPPSANIPGMPALGGAAGPESNSLEAQRLELIREEIRRRRALRQQPPQNGPTPNHSP